MQIFRIITQVCLTALFCTFFACNNQLEEKKEYDANKTLVASFSVDKETNFKEGEYRKYFSSGKLRELANYVHDTLNGERTLYFESGSIEVKENYLYGIFHGNFTSFYSNGNVNVTGEYLNNEANGEWKRYYDTGELMEITEMKNNEENGPFTEYYKNGKLKTKGEYINGPFEHGELILYDEKGEPIKKMQCDQGECVTTWTANG